MKCKNCGHDTSTNGKMHLLIEQENTIGMGEMATFSKKCHYCKCNKPESKVEK